MSTVASGWLKKIQSSVGNITLLCIFSLQIFFKIFNTIESFWLHPLQDQIIQRVFLENFLVNQPRFVFGNQSLR